MSGIDPKYFTPGPWIVAEVFLEMDEDGEEVTAPAIFQKEDYENEIDEPCPLVVGETNWGEIENDLRLMALAPDMLAVLKALISLPVAAEQLGYLRNGTGTKTPNRAWLDAANLIAKAEAQR